MTVPRVLAIDAGKSDSRAASFVDGRRGSSASGPGIENVASPGGPERVRASLGATLTTLLGGERYDAVCIGLTGVLAPSHARVVADVILELTAAPRIVVTSDVVTAYSGALGLVPGVVVAAGTGSIILAAGPDGRLARVDGWGYLLDDGGSAFEIGRGGLREALRAADGRGGSHALYDAAVSEFGAIAEVTDAVYGSDNPTRTVAGFASVVAQVASAGDQVATGLLRHAAETLAHGAGAAASRVLGRETPVAVSWHGGVFRAGALVIEPFLAALGTELPLARPVPPRGDGLDGAAILATATGGTVLDGLVTVRERSDS